MWALRPTSHSHPSLRHEIWFPAFAGMSGNVATTPPPDEQPTPYSANENPPFTG
jgi:hypothetical protein